LSITDGFPMFSMRLLVCQQNVLKVMSSVFVAVWHVRVCSAGIIISLKNYIEAVFLFHCISVL